MNRVTEAAMLLEQARRLRELAPKLDHPMIKDDILRLAERCAELAETANDATVQRWHYETAASTAAPAGSRWAPQPGTIEEVPAPTHESLKNVYAYWLAKRGYRIAPPRSVMQLENLAQMRPNIALADMVGDPPRFRFRIYGTNLTAAYGEDLTGRFLDEIDMGTGSLTAGAVNFWAKIVREGRPQVARVCYTKRRDGRHFAYERIGLPLSEDGRSVTVILLAYAPEFLNALG